MKKYCRSVFVSFTPVCLALTISAEVSAQDQSKASEFVLEEIIVTAQKREQNLFDVPVSVSALMGEQLQESGGSSLEDYAAYIPGLNFQSGGGPGMGAVTLRGVSPIGTTPSVAVYLDEVPMGASSLVAASTTLVLDLFPYDLERLEVIRGPQGTLYGGNALGGLLKYVTKRPNLYQNSLKLGGGVKRISNGGNAGYDYRGQGNLAAIPEQLAFTVSAYKENNDGFIDNSTTGESDINKGSRDGVRVAMLWEPTDDTSVYLTAISQSTDLDGLNFAHYDFLDSSKPLSLAGELESSYLLDNTFKQEIDYYSVIVEFDLDWASLTSISSHSETDTVRVLDYSPGYSSLALLASGGAVSASLTPYSERIKLERVTQEFRLSSNSSDSLEWLVGAFYTDETVLDEHLASSMALDGSLLKGLHPVFSAEVPSKYKELAVFANTTYYLNERWDFSLGLRWTDNEQSTAQSGNGLIFGFVPLVSEGDASESVLTYMAGSSFDVNEDLMVYGRVATGYRPGGPNVALPGVPPSVDADTVLTYELGAKAVLLNQRLSLELSAFHTEWDDIQTQSQSANGLGYIVNSDSAEIQGIELSTVFHPIEGLQLGLNFAYTDAIFTSDSETIGAANGDILPNVPEWQGSIAANYETALSDGLILNIGGGWRYVGDQQYYNLSFGPRSIKSYDMLDLNVGISSESWRISLFAKNVLNEKAHLSERLVFDQLLGTPLFTEVNMAQPATVGLSFDVEF